MSTKQKIYNQCLDLIDEKIKNLHSALLNATESAHNETKSTAGDKHETARAMMQLEQEKLGNQLKELLELKAELEKIDVSKNSKQISKGSLIETDKGYLFIAIGLGKVIAEEKTVVVLSAQSPLGNKLMGKKENDVVEMNGVYYKIEKLH